ncbi:MAG: biotin/lipoyl-binding protein [Oscillospiraceae bacterium]|jgi:glutaconyl-CoA decarboxylase|nr:biotin/lipoyl-binding protein [Oscillospiraceae bacterium]
MRSFQITVNGKTYQVQVEETSGAPAAQVAVAAPIVQAIPAPVAPSTPKSPPIVQKTAPAQAVAGDPIVAPMPGTIMSVAVSVGQAVKKHDVLLVLEAMKMENEIVASRDGTIAQVLVSKGSTVNTGDKLVVLG